MRGSSLKSPSQNRTCPIKAYGSSISHLPNKHFSDISSDSPMGVSLGYPHTFSTLANRFGLCVSCSSITPGGHIYNTSAILYNSHRFHSTCNALSASHLMLWWSPLYSHAYAPISISLWLHVSFSASSCWFYAVRSTSPSGLLQSLPADFSFTQFRIQAEKRRLYFADCLYL